MPRACSLLSSERATLGESGLTTGRLAQDGGAALADDNGLGVGEDGGDDEAAGALDVHEEGSRGGDKSLRKELYVRSQFVEVGVCRWHVGMRRTLSLCFLASAAAEGFRRSTART